MRKPLKCNCNVGLDKNQLQFLSARDKRQSSHFDSSLFVDGFSFNVIEDGRFRYEKFQVHKIFLLIFNRFLL